MASSAGSLTTRCRASLMPTSLQQQQPPAVFSYYFWLGAAAVPSRVPCNKSVVVIAKTDHHGPEFQKVGESRN